jgi:hypothetical protein
MRNKVNPIEQRVKDGIHKGIPLTVKEIKTLRAESQKASTLFKGIFWGGIVLFNLALWVPLPIQINQNLLYLIAFIALAVALVVPLPALRKHQASLELLKVNKQGLKKKTASEAGRAYIDQVKQQDRPFINAEFELLAGSKWTQKDE